jgi:hypothetical protein
LFGGGGPGDETLIMSLMVTCSSVFVVAGHSSDLDLGSILRMEKFWKSAELEKSFVACRLCSLLSE